MIFRFYGQSFAFSLVPLGNVPMPGPVIITYPDTVGHVTTGNRTMLLHWNPGLSSITINCTSSKMRHFISEMGNVNWLVEIGC